MSNEEKKPLYTVKWADAWASHDYYGEHSSYGPVIMEDVGWVVEENDETIVLGRSRSPTGAYRQLSTIPWDMVVSMEELT